MLHTIVSGEVFFENFLRGLFGLKLQEKFQPFEPTRTEARRVGAPRTHCEARRRRGELTALKFGSNFLV